MKTQDIHADVHKFLPMLRTKGVYVVRDTDGLWRNDEGDTRQRKAKQIGFSTLSAMHEAFLREGVEGLSNAHPHL